MVVNGTAEGTLETAGKGEIHEYPRSPATKLPSTSTVTTRKDEVATCMVVTLVLV